MPQDTICVFAVPENQLNQISGQLSGSEEVGALDIPKSWTEVLYVEIPHFNSAIFLEQLVFSSHTGF